MASLIPLPIPLSQRPHDHAFNVYSSQAWFLDFLMVFFHKYYVVSFCMFLNFMQIYPAVYIPVKLGFVLHHCL